MDFGDEKSKTHALIAMEDSRNKEVVINVVGNINKNRINNSFK